MTTKYVLLTIIVAAFLMSGCKDDRQNAADNLEKANQDLNEAQLQFENEWQQFKNDAKMKINDNQNNIIAFKSAIKSSGNKFKAARENEVLLLEQKNIALRKKLNEYTYKMKDDWEDFKTNFNSEMDNFSNAAKELFERKE